MSTPQVSDLVRWFAELVAAWGIAVVQPLLSLLGDSTDFFLSYGFSPGDVRTFVVGIVLVPPGATWILEVLTRRWPVARARIHYIVVALCVLAAVAQVAKTVLKLDGIDYVLVASIFSVLALGVYLRWEPLREWLSFAALVPILAVGLFATTSPSGRYALATEEPASATTAGLIKVPVVMLMLDEFPLASLLDGTGEIDSVRYPNFARLASISTWYRNYSTTSELTGYAIPSTLSGLRPKKGTSPTYVDHPDSLISILGVNHDMRVSETLTNLCPPNTCSPAPNSPTNNGSVRHNWGGFLRGIVSVLRQRLDTTKTNEVDVFATSGSVAEADTTATTSGDGVSNSAPSSLQLLANSQASTLGQWIDQLEPPTGSGKPVFNFLHVLFPHQKWMFLPDGSTYRSPGPEWNEDETAWQVRVREQRHILQVEYLDSLIGRLLDKLESTGLLDTALVIVAADHGISFMHGYHRRFTGGDFANATQLMHVPLFIRYPNQATGSVDDSNVENIDVLPMLAERLNFTIPWKIDGVAPDKKSSKRAELKTLYLIGRPLGGPPRSASSITVPMTRFARETLTWGFRGGRRDDVGLVEFLYAVSPYSTIVGKKVSEFTTTRGPLSFSLSDSQAWGDRPFQVSGMINGDAEASTWFAFAIDGQLLGLAPSAAGGSSTPVTALLPTNATNANGLAVYRVVNRSTLEVVRINR